MSSLRVSKFVSLAALFILTACAPTAPKVYGGQPGTGGGTVEPASATTEGTGFEVTSEMPAECQELATPCEDCNEVERTRRRILEKKCVRVCEAYIDAGPAFSENVLPEVDAELRKPGVCGKTETTCSAVEQSQCAYAMKYASVGRPFVKSWASTNTVPPNDELLESYYQGALVPLDSLNREVFEWGRVNEVNVKSLLEASLTIARYRLTGTTDEVFGELSSRLPKEGSETGEKERRAYGAARKMWSIATTVAPASTYKTAWDAAAETFITSRAGATKDGSSE